MKAQTQAVSVVIITGIVVTLVGATYFWGAPLIEKRTTITQVLATEQFMESLDKKIVDMAKSCIGSCEEDVNIPTNALVRVITNTSDPENNSITLEFTTKQVIMSNGTIPLNTNVLGEVAPFGETEGVITIRQVSYGDVYKIILKLHYRELDTRTTPRKGFKIMLESGSLAGNQKIRVSYSKEPSTIPGGAANDGDLILTYIGIDTV